jgi:hypothetical protein
LVEEFMNKTDKFIVAWLVISHTGLRFRETKAKVAILREREHKKLRGEQMLEQIVKITIF